MTELSPAPLQAAAATCAAGRAELRFANGSYFSCCEETELVRGSGGDVLACLLASLGAAGAVLKLLTSLQVTGRDGTEEMVQAL